MVLRTTGVSLRGSNPLVPVKTMNKYLFLYKQNPNQWGRVQGEADSEVDFLKSVEDNKIEDYYWEVMKLDRVTKKEAYTYEDDIEDITS